MDEIKKEAFNGWDDKTDFHSMLKFAKSSKVMLRDLNSSLSTDQTYSKYSKEQVVTYIANPVTYEKQLRDMSRYLFNISCQYRRLIQYFANMLTYAYILYPLNLDSKDVDEDKFYKQYLKAKESVDVMNIRHEFAKILNVAFTEDVFYGYINETSGNFMIQQLNPEYCKIDSVVDGVYSFSWNSSYFNGKEALLAFYDPEFTTAYNAYKEDSAKRWAELDPKRSICIKINETNLTPIPPFVSLFSALADIEDYRAITKNASEISNYKALSLKMPVDSDGNLQLPKSLCIEFYNALLDVLPENIGAFLTPMEVSDWSFEKSGGLSDTDLVAKAEDAFFRSSGTNGLLFGSGSDPTSSALQMSIKSDEEICFRVLRQLERWVNGRLKSISGNVKFQINFLDVTIFNRQEMNDMYMKLGQYGMPVRMAIAATADFTPGMTEGMSYLENVLLKLSDNEIPLKSSNVQSGDEAGRPTNKSKGKALTDSGEKTKENDSNENR